jgi:hypothetical protein
MGRKSKGSYSEKKLSKKLINDDNKEPNLKEVSSSKRQKQNPVTRNEDILWTTK